MSGLELVSRPAAPGASGVFHGGDDVSRLRCWLAASMGGQAMTESENVAQTTERLCKQIARLEGALEHLKSGEKDNEIYRLKSDIRELKHYIQFDVLQLGHMFANDNEKWLTLPVRIRDIFERGHRHE